jgi:DsbC/DsbD-like thiol-disulfide interchange protein
LVCILCLPFLCQAQQNKLTVAPAGPTIAKRGGTVAQILKVTVLPGYHVNSDKPRDEFLIPLKLTWTDGPLEAQSINYPKPEEIKVGRDMLVVFTGDFAIQTEFKTSDKAVAGPATMNGKLRYQACNNEMCFRPTTVDIHVSVVIQ